VQGIRVVRGERQSLRAFWPDSFGELNFGHRDRLERSAARAQARLAEVRPGHRAFGLRLAESRELGRGEPHPGLVSPIDAVSKALIPLRTCVRDHSRLGLHALPPSLDRGNVTEALSAASELQFVALAEALELTLLLADKEPEKYDRAAARWHSRFLQETKNVDLRESLAVLTLLAAIPANRLAATALAELLSRRRSCERIAEALVQWSRA